MNLKAAAANHTERVPLIVIIISLWEVEEFKMTDSFNEVSLGLPIILRGSVFFFSSFN